MKKKSITHTNSEDLNFDQSRSEFANDDLYRNMHQEYVSRINQLQQFAKEDGYSLNPKSEIDFWSFIKSVPRWCRGYLIMQENGDLRLIWKDNNQTRLGLLFQGNEVVQYVIFKKLDEKQKISRSSGRDSFAGVKQKIDNFELDSLLIK